MPLLYHWTKVDPLVDDYLHISPYAYCNWNPIKYVDPDGMDSRDVIIGYSLGVLTSLIPGTSFLRDIYTPNSSVDYNKALANVDNASLIVGSGMTAAGASGVGAGTAISIAGGVTAASVVGAPEGVLVAAGGGAVIAGSEALTVSGAVLMANAVSNKSQGYNRGNKNTPNKNSNFSNSRKMTNEEIGQFFGDKDWHKKDYKKSLMKNFQKELKGSTNVDLFVDKTTKQVYLKGNKSGAWVDTGETF